MKLAATVALSTIAASAGLIGSSALQVAEADAAPRPIPPRAFPIPNYKPHVKFYHSNRKLAFIATGMPRGEKVCLFEGYYGDPWFGSLGVKAWQPLYERYELSETAKARSTPKAPGVYPVRLTCRMQTHLILRRAGTIRVPVT
ncbi:MAG: hypothetical protein QM728_01035 [Gordonia sp. (in: high G+C Gram-positive bacteria)]|uniref:hypothetical protein n=1 Tax=Gordonia sp. (in: high G+C Gram-positive bacteria) TaxID=84139 RepID=UPI0039E508DA